MDVSNLSILVHYPGGDAITVEIPARCDAPAVGYTNETRQGRNNSILTKTDKIMEYWPPAGRQVDRYYREHRHGVGPRHL